MWGLNGFFFFGSNSEENDIERMSVNCVSVRYDGERLTFQEQEDVEACYPALLPTTSASLICCLHLYSAKVLVASQNRDSIAK